MVKTITKNDFFKYILLINVGMIGIILISNDNNPLSNSLVMLCTAFISTFLVKFDVFHPYTWFSAFFTLYSIGYALTCAIGYESGLGYTYYNILYSYIALIVVLLLVGPKKLDINKNFHRNDSININNLKILLYCLIIIVFVSTVILILRGYSGKAEMKQASDIFYKIGVYAIRYDAMFITFFLCYNIEFKKTKFYLPIIMSVLVAIFFSLYTGERDAMFRIIAIIMLILFSYNKLKKKHLIIAIPIFVFFMISSVIFKYYFINGNLNLNYLGNNDILYLFLSTDFSAAGSNIQKLLNTYWTKGYAGYSLFITEIFSPFLPSSVGFNPDYWFNYEVYTGGFHGRAFTLVGTGYIIDGIFGIILLFIIVGIVIKYLYRNSKRNLYISSTYIYMITTIIFASRQSLSTIFISLIRICFVSIICCKFIFNTSKSRK